MPFPIDRSFVEDLQHSVSSRLPDCYISFMMQKNGGTIELNDDDWELHPIKDTSDRKRLSRTANHVLLEQSTYESWPRFVPETLSIATNGSGDRLVLKRHRNAYLPEIYHWDHETGELNLIASSITEAHRK